MPGETHMHWLRSFPGSIFRRCLLSHSGDQTPVDTSHPDLNPHILGLASELSGALKLGTWEGWSFSGGTHGP